MTNRISKKRKKKEKLPKIGSRTVKNPSEYKCFQKLVDLLPSDVKVEYEVEDIPYIIEGKYKVDFTITFPKKDGRIIHIEYKGAGRSFDYAVQRKMIAVKKQHPEMDYKIVFHRDAEFGSRRKDGSRQRQSDWAKRYGFDFCVGIENIPEEWFK